MIYTRKFILFYFHCHEMIRLESKLADAKNVDFRKTAKSCHFCSNIARKFFFQMNGWQHCYMLTKYRD